MMDILMDLIKFAIDRLKNNPVGAELLVIAGMLFAAIFSVQYYNANPKTFAAIHNYYFQATAILALSTWAASLCWRYAKIRTLKIMATIIFIVIGSGGATWIIRSSQVTQLHIRLVFDDSVHLSPGDKKKLIDRLQSPLFQVDMYESSITPRTANIGQITDDEVQVALKQTNNLLSAQKETGRILPILITGRMLEDDEWQNLMMIAWENAAVISIWEVAGNGASLSDITVGKYVATSIALEALEANALQANKIFLDDRNPDLYSGCLSDFNRTRETYISQSQQPKLCELEEKVIRNAFGGATVKALEDIFRRITDERTATN